MPEEATKTSQVYIDVDVMMKCYCEVILRINIIQEGHYLCSVPVGLNFLLVSC